MLGIGSLGHVWTPAPVERDHPLNHGLAAWCLGLPPLEGGINVPDLALNGVGATLNGWSAAAWTTTPIRPGAIGPYIKHAASTYAEVNGLYSRLIGQSKATLALWLYSTATNNDRRFGQGNTTAEFGLQKASDSSYYAIVCTGAAQVYGAVNVSTTGWEHVVMVFDGSLVGNARIALYVNGLVKTLSYTGSPPATIATPSTLQAFWLGRDQAGYSTSGIGWDDFRCYAGRALGASEAAELYRESLQGYPAALRRVRKRAWLIASSASTTPIADTDAGTLAESAALAAALTGTDAAALAEAAALAAALDGTEGGTVAESVALAAALATADAATFAESVVLVAALATTDAGSLTDDGVAESFTGATDSDTGTLAQATTLAAALAGSDALTFTEAGSIAVVLAGADTGTLAETATVGGQRLYPTSFRVTVATATGTVDPDRTTVQDS